MSDGVEQVESVGEFPSRAPDAHKGDFGRVLVVGGSRGMIGAPALAANAALRGGAGLVTVAAPEEVQLAVAVLCPCATSVPLVCDDDGHLTPEAVRQVRQAAEAADVLAVGPGLALGTVQRDIVRLVLQLAKPLVLDADGLNNLAGIEDWAAGRKCPAVLTPHPGEFARLTGAGVREIQSDRQQQAVAAVRRWADASFGQLPLVCLLKGRGTVVTDGRRAYVNDTGNPGMATGGSGDVLTGLAAAIIAQGAEPFAAACLAARIHGRAGDLAAEQGTQISTIATDLLDFLPAAIEGHCCS